MTRTPRLLPSVRTVVLALGVLAAATPLAFAHSAYPAGWNDTTVPFPPAADQFVPGGDRLHEVIVSPPVQATPVPAGVGQTAPHETYKMVPGGLRYHRVE